MHARARFSLRVAALGLLTAQTSLLSAQQYGGGIVLDPLQPGNINRIYERNREALQSENARSNVTAPTERQSWDQRAQRAFLAGNYPLAAKNLRHALADEPQNGIYALRLGQAYFALGTYDDAADAIRKGMVLLPRHQWGLVVKNYKVLYPKNQIFTTQLRALEQECKENPDNPAARFLLGYQYLYLGYPKNAETELQVALELQPGNPFSQELASAAGGSSEAAALPTRLPTDSSSVSSDTPSTRPAKPRIHPPD